MPKRTTPGLVVNTPPTPLSINTAKLAAQEAETRLAYVRSSTKVDGYEGNRPPHSWRKSDLIAESSQKNSGQVIFKMVN